MIIDNSWYGHRAILSRYCGCSDSHIHAFIAHSQEPYIYKDRSYPVGFTRHPILVWNKFEEINATSRGCNHVHAVGSPFLYLLRIRTKPSHPTHHRRGTIVFPIHGVPGLQVHHNVTKWAQLIKSNFPPPYCASIPVFDPLYTIKKKAFVQQGFDVVSFGARTDINFLHRFIDIVQNFKFATSDDTGATALLYSMALGLSVYHFSRKPLIDFIYKDSKNRPYLPAPLFEAFQTSFLSGPDAIQLSNMILGHDSLLSPSDLSSLIGLSSLYRKTLANLYSCSVRLRYGLNVYNNPIDIKIQRTKGTQTDLSPIHQLQLLQGIHDPTLPL